MGGLEELPARDLEAIVRALESGRLRPPFQLESFVPICARQDTATRALELTQGLAALGAKQELLLEVFRTVSRARALADGGDGDLELVWTGPEAPGIDNRDTGVVVRGLFRLARRSVLVAGFAVYQGKEIFEELAANMDANPALKVKFFLNVHREWGDMASPEALLARFMDKFKREDWPGKRLPDVYYDPRSLEMEGPNRALLHAKCVVRDGEEAFITSANFTERAQRRNIEAGVLIHQPRIAAKLGAQFEALARVGVLQKAPI